MTVGREGMSEDRGVGMSEDRELGTNLLDARSEESASDTASSEAGITDYLDKHPECTMCALVQATSPLTTAEDFKSGMKLFKDAEADSMVSFLFE